MHVDDGIDLVRAGDGLVDALAVDRHHLLRAGEKLEEGAGFGRRKPRCRSHGAHRPLAGSGQRFIQSIHMLAHIGPVDAPALVEIGEQPGKERRVAIRADGEMQIRQLAGGRAARIDGDNPHGRPRRLGCFQPLEQHRMAPCTVGAHQHHEIRLFQILIAARHGIRPEGPPVTGDGRGHAQARIGVDVGRTDEALHQLVGGIIIFRQQLAGTVDGNAVWPMLADGLAEPAGDKIQRHIPGGPAPADFRMEQPALQRQRVRQRRALGAEPPEVGGMLRIALHGDGAIVMTGGQHAAADTAIGAGGAGGFSHPASPLARSGHAGSARRG